MNENQISLEEQLPKKYRHWIIVLYEDTTSYNFNEVLKLIKSHKYYAYIKHLPEAEEKKEHYHVILSFDNATKQETLSKKLGVPIYHIQPIKNLRSVCRYLIHLDDEDKTQYEIGSVVVSKNFERKFYKSFDDQENEEDIMNNIYKFIDNLKQANNNYYENTRLLIMYVNAHCYDTLYKRYRPEFIEYLKQSIVN